MRRWIEPSVFVFLLALLASLGIHLPAYEALGVLARVLDVNEPPPRQRTKVEFTVGDATEPDDPEREGAPADTSNTEADSSSEHDPRTADPEPKREPPERKRKKKPRRQEKKNERERNKPEEDEKKTKKKRTNPRNLHAVTQHADDSDEAPENPRFVSEENNKVEEQTVARMRNDVRDDPNPRAPSTRDERSSSKQGNARQRRVEEMRDREGSDVREPTPEETRRQRPKESPEAPASPERQQGGGTNVGGGNGAEGEAGSQGERRLASARKQSRVRPERAEGASSEDRAARNEEMLTIEDGYGTLRVPAGGSRGGGGRGENNVQGRQRGRGTPSEGARGGDPGQGVGPVGPGQRFAYSQLRQLYGRKQLKKERQAYVEERRSKQRGTSHQQRWERFKSAIENYVADVRPGNQTALNAAASPFADYIASAHRRLHEEFAGDFLAGLPTFSSSPFSDRSLHTELEIILNGDGTVHRVGVVESSGFLPFDYGAFRSVLQAQPYPEPPSSIRSGDGRVYLHWGFYRNQRQCGTFNAKPYILPDPPGTPAPGEHSPLRDRPAQDGVIPEDASPSWKTDG